MGPLEPLNPPVHSCQLCEVSANQRRVTRHHLIPRSQQVNFPVEYAEQAKDGANRVWLCVDCHGVLHRWFSVGELAVHLNTAEKLKTNWLVIQWLRWKKTNPGASLKQFRPTYDGVDDALLVSVMHRRYGSRPVIVESTTNGIWLRLGSVARLLFTDEAQVLRDHLTEALTHCGTWSIPAVGAADKKSV